MHDFAYRRAASADDLGRLPIGAVLLAGGQSLLPMVKARDVRPPLIVDVKPMLPRGVRLDGNRLVIGAGTTHAELAADPVLRSEAPCLADLADHVGDPSVRHRGTLGGALVSDHPAGDWPPVALALDAMLTTTERTVSFEGWREDGAHPGEVVLEVALRRPEATGYVKLLHPAQRYAIVGALAARVDGREVRAVTGLYVEGARLWNGRPDDAAIRSDGFAAPDYRAALAVELVRRAETLRDGTAPFARAIVHGQARG